MVYNGNSQAKGIVEQKTGNEEGNAMTTEIRERNCCPSCKSICIAKYRKLSGKYKCKACRAIFVSPVTREIAAHRPIPKHLRKIIEQKQKEALVGDVE